jgi:acetyltransferase-like isoleucine patch superfamily enzyme
MNVVVMPGIKIGNNVVVGSNSVVTKDIPSNSIAAGNPCRVLKDKPEYQGIKYENFL